MTDAVPVDRLSASLERVWKPLSKAFEERLKLAGVPAAPFYDVLDKDFPKPLEISISGTSIGISDGGAICETAPLEVLDSADPSSTTGFDALSSIGQSLADRLRRRLLVQLADELVGESEPIEIGNLTREIWQSQVITALDGGVGTLWVDWRHVRKAKKWSEDLAAVKVRNIGEALYLSRRAGARRELRMLLFPSSPKLIARKETLPLTLGYDSMAPAETSVRLRCWYYYHIYVAEQARSRIRWWS